MREMKDSGIDWVGDIPAEWKTSKIKYVATIQSGLFIDKQKYEEDGAYDIIGANGIVGHYSKSNNLRPCLTTGRVGTIGTIHKTNKAWVTDNALMIYENDKISQSYLGYVVPNFDFTKMTAGTAMPLITATKLYSQRIPFPDKNEQCLIASFLDAKCAEIDALAADIQAEIDTLEQYKRSVIAKAVTKGLNPDAKMKDSGIAWIGEIPEHWESKPIRAVFEEVTRKNQDGSVKVALKFTYGKIVRKTNFDAEEDNYVADTILNYTIVEPGAIVLNGLNLNFDFVTQRIGLVRELGIITSAYMSFKSIDNKYMLPEYSTYLFKSYDECKAFHNMGGGVRKILNFSEFKKYYIPVPPCEEQVQIIHFLDSKCAEIDSIIADKHKQLETLDSYKKSIIFEYVTGKKEVAVA